MTHIARVRRPSSSSTRSRISCAALFVNVIARISFARAIPVCLEVRDPVREHARLARAGAREDQQRALAVRDGVALGRVETGEEIGDPVLGRCRACHLEHRPGIGGHSREAVAAPWR